MELTTKCPQCNTIFQASLQQLQLRKGYVRCVHCSHIFDGYEAVVAGGQAPDPDAEQPVPAQPQPAQSDPEPVLTTPSLPVEEPDQPTEPVIAPAASTAPRTRTPARREFTVSDFTTKTADDAGSAQPDAPLHTFSERSISIRRDARAEPSIGTLTSAHSRHEPKREPNIGNTAVDDFGSALGVEPGIGDGQAQPAAPTAAPEPQDEGADDVYVDRLGAWLRLMWQGLIAVGVLVLLVQVMVVFRMQIAEALPASRPVLERLCNGFNCTVAWSRRSDDISITHSALKANKSSDDADDDSANEEIADNAEDDATDTADQDTQTTDVDKQEFVLEVTLRNSYGKPQEWPSLSLELTDAAGARIARRHLAAENYLPDNMLDQPFPANSERRIALPLTLQGLNVNGYQLTTFFP